MFARLLTLSLIFFTSSFALLQPMMHEVICPLNGWIAQTLKLENEAGHSCCSAHAHTCCASEEISTEFTLVVVPETTHCDGDCIAIILENSTSHLLASGEWMDQLSQSAVAITLVPDRLVAVSSPRSRGPPIS